MDIVATSLLASIEGRIEISPLVSALRRTLGAVVEVLSRARAAAKGVEWQARFLALFPPAILVVIAITTPDTGRLYSENPLLLSPVIIGSGVSYWLSTRMIRSVDNAGWETLSAVQNVRVDTLKPGLEMVPDQTKGGKDYFHRAVTVSLKATDGGSGVARMEYRLDGGNWVQANTLTISTDGGHGLEGRVTDNAGNVTWKAIPVYIDTIPPVAAFVLPVPNSTAIESGTVLVGGNASDIGSGVERVELSLDQGKTWQTLPLVNEIWNYNWDTLNIPNGRYQIIARAWDIAGNVQSPGASITLVVDNRLPDKATATLSFVTNISLTLTPTRTPTPSPTLTITATSTHTIQPMQTMTVTPTPAATAIPVPVSPPTGKPLSLWPIVGLIGLLMALASASLTDRRPQALRRIGQTFNQIVAQKKLDNGE